MLPPHQDLAHGATHAKANRNAKPISKPQRLFDGGGLYIEIAPSGGKWWRLKYRFSGKEKRLSLGVFPIVGLKDARDGRDEARRQLAKKIDPGLLRKANTAMQAERASNCFEAVAREWYAKHSPAWATTHSSKIERRLERDIFPWMGSRAIADITAPELLKVLRRIEERGALETAHRALQNCSQVFRYAVATGRAERDPSIDLRGALPPVKEKHHASITDPKAVGALLRAIDGYQGSTVTKSALHLAPLLFVRPGELRKAEWSEFDFEKAEWRIPAARMKMRELHIVPLSKQALSILEGIKTVTCSDNILSGATDLEWAILITVHRISAPLVHLSARKIQIELSKRDDR